MSAPKLEAKVETITPERAKRLLDKIDKKAAGGGLHHRTIKREKVEQYARDMAAGRWQLNGETIILTSEGVVIDGLHRLTACVKADTQFQTMVTRGAPDDTFKSIDTGAIRTGGDLMTIAGVVGGNALATALAVVWKYDQGNGKLTSASWHDRPTKPELFEVLDKHKDLPHFVAKAGPLNKLLSHGLCGALWYLFAKRDATLADVFFDTLKTGEGLKEGEPVHALRERLYKDRAMRPRPTMQMTAELVVRAWNHTRGGKQLAKMQRGAGPVDLAIR